jgi:hypothetical protein
MEVSGKLHVPAALAPPGRKLQVNIGENVCVSPKARVGAVEDTKIFHGRKSVAIPTHPPKVNIL